MNVEKEARQCLDTFMKHMMNHALNEGKTPRVKVEASLEAWRKVVQEHEEDMDYLQNKYITTHHMPRVEAKQQVQQYDAQRSQLYHTWQQTKNQGDLRAWISFAPTFKQEAYMDPLFTYRSSV